MPAEFPIVVVGLGATGLAVVHRLHALGLPVRALLTPGEMERRFAELEELGIDVVPVSEAWETDLVRLDLSQAGAIVLAADTDAENVDACLIVRRYNPDVPLLARVSDPTLVRFLRMGVPHVDAYSMGSTTAPVAAEMAIQLIAERKARAQPPPRRPPPTVTRARTWLLYAVLAVALLLVPAGVMLAKTLGLKGLDGVHATVTAMLTGDLSEVARHRVPEVARWLALGIKVIERLLLMGIIALVVDWLLIRRLTTMVVAAPVHMKDHVVVLGAGNVGARVAELLHKRKTKVVVIEADGKIRNVQRLRSAGIPVVVGDATVDETLDLAAAWQAGAALALTNSDAVNLHVGLQLTDKKVGVPTVVRLLSPELIAQMEHHPDIAPLSPVAETASHVCRAAERMRADRVKARQESPAMSETPRPMGRFAGPEFEVARVHSTTDQFARQARATANEAATPAPAVGEQEATP